MSFPQENADDLHSAGSLLTLATTVGWKHTDLESVSPHCFLSTGRHLLGVPFVTSLKSDLCVFLTIQNTTENNCIISHAYKATPLEPNILLNGICQLIVTGRSAIPNVNH